MKWSQPAASLAISGSHACALSASGKVSCWSHGPAAELPFFDDAVSIALSQDVLCVLRDNGMLECGGLGMEPTGEIAPIQIPVRQDVTAVAGTDGYLCAIRADGAVACWGDTLASLGFFEARPDSEVETLVSGGQDAKRLSLGRREACLVRDDSTVACWGGAISSLEATSGTPPLGLVAFALPGSKDTVAVASGSHSCLLARSGGIHCWGFNVAGELGSPSEAVWSTERVPVLQIDDATAIAAGDEFTCARRADRSTWCWGSASAGRLGDGTSMELAPVEVPNVAGATTLAVSEQRSCAINGSDQLVCWGGKGSIGNSDAVEVVLSTNASQQAARGVYLADYPVDVVCVLDAVGDLRCKGNEFTSAPLKLGADKVVIDQMWSENIALVAGKVVLWTLARDGSLTTRRVEGISNAVDVAGGHSHVCAVLASGRVSCFHPRQTNDKPSLVEGIEDARSITGNGVFLALRKNGDALTFSEVYRPDEQSKKAARKVSPFRLTPITKVSKLTRGSTSHSGSCALDGNGALYCWGANDEGKLGLDTKAQIVEPTLSKVQRVRAVALGRSHGCALSDGKVYCWGSNRSRQVTPVASARFLPRPILDP